jgi:hypothetical protein
MVFNATFNNITDILWRSVFLVGENGGSREKHPPTQITEKLYHRPAQVIDKLYHKMMYRVHTVNFTLNLLNVPSIFFPYGFKYQTCIYNENNCFLI